MLRLRRRMVKSEIGSCRLIMVWGSLFLLRFLYMIDAIFRGLLSCGIRFQGVSGIGHFVLRGLFRDHTIGRIFRRQR